MQLFRPPISLQCPNDIRYQSRRPTPAARGTNCESARASSNRTIDKISTIAFLLASSKIAACPASKRIPADNETTTIRSNPHIHFVKA
jgi:hypothetical protein